MFKEFKQFLLRGNVIDLAVAVVIGAAFNNVVQALVKDLITPLVTMFGGSANFSGLQVKVGNSVFTYGDFLNTAISFAIIAAVVFFFVVTPINKLVSLARTQPTPDPNTTHCPECLSEIPTKARRCAFCTAVVKPAK